MATMKDRIVILLQARPGLSDGEIASALFGIGAAPQSTNQACRAMAARGVVVRRVRHDGRIGNYLVSTGPGGHASPARSPAQATSDPRNPDSPSEDEIKHYLQAWLEKQGWDTAVRWGHEQGIDIEATKAKDRWIIEVKGSGSRNAMRVNYFLAILGELLQRMDDPRARYSIALPALAQFSRLWRRLPSLAKKRTGISALFVANDGSVLLAQ